VAVMGQILLLNDKKSVEIVPHFDLIMLHDNKPANSCNVLATNHISMEIQVKSLACSLAHKSLGNASFYKKAKPFCMLVWCLFYLPVLAKAQ
jgi:hypothetical protein